MKGVNPVDLPEMWDTFTLAGLRSPGICKFPDLIRDEGWDVQVPKGSTGGNTVHNNTKPISFGVELRLWKDAYVDHFDRWEDWKGLLVIPIKKDSPKALDILHPQLEGLGIRSVVAQTRAEYIPDGRGGATVKWKFLEYRPIQPAKSQGPNGSKGSGAGSTSTQQKKSDPNADLKKEVEELTKQFKEAGQ
jgi:hypothetical protein